MELKRYQERVLREESVFLEELAKQQAAGTKRASMEAWEEAGKILGHSLYAYQGQNTGLNRDLPTFCVKVPTGGGKTLLAAQSLGLIYKSILKERNGAGLVLWIVPSDQIYKDTLRNLRDRRHSIREVLEFTLSRRIEVWEKHDIARLTPGQLRSNLNILLLILASTNRETRDQLKFFRDSGGNIVQHFPPEEAVEKHKALKERIPNLDMLVDDDKKGVHLVKTSLANLVRICEPPVILDEGHKAASALARETIAGFNASIIVELSATPPDEANILTKVSGQNLLDEHMIKLPINISNSNQKSWKDCLTQARDKREQLARMADKHYKATNRFIRPIILVQVERTGADQRGSGLIHSEEVKELLMQRLGVPEAAIKIKSSEKDDIEGIDLLAEGCPVEWIITKAALQEGWDCSFAYILVSLSNTRSQQSMTQIVGRVLRQPYQEKTEFDELNQSYIFCLQRSAGEIAREVKFALEKEGYEGNAASVIDQSDQDGKNTPKREIKMREEFRPLYRKWEGKVYLPRFCVKDGPKKNDFEALDYFRHLISRVDVEKFDFAAVEWDLTDELKKAKDTTYRISLGQDETPGVEESDTEIFETDEQVKAWIVSTLQFNHFSQKQLHRVVERAVDNLVKKNSTYRGKLALVKFPIHKKIEGLIDRGTDEQTHAVFDDLFKKKRLCFFLECLEARFEIPPVVEIHSTRRLLTEDGEQIQQSLFDYVPDDMNDYEKAVALFLDNRPEVLWWYLNLVGREHFSVQGYKRNKIYPDFVVQEGNSSTGRKKPIPSVLVVESKGKHLKGNEDTNYKRNVANYFEKVGHKVSWQKLAEDFNDHSFRFQVLDEGEYKDKNWRDDLRRKLEESSSI